jgi:Mor family transcriptional regulator
LSKAIIKASYEEMGGLRISWPSLKDLDREFKYERIRILFNGSNHAELGIMFGYTVTQIRRIVNRRGSKEP